LESNTWEVTDLRLPQPTCGIPCFKLRDTEVFLVIKETLYSFTALEVRPIKTLPKESEESEDIGSWNGASYYYNGTLYCSGFEGAVLSHKIGSLSY
jgi:hypothetical protein